MKESNIHCNTAIINVPRNLWSNEQLAWESSWNKDRSGREDRNISEIEGILSHKFLFETHLLELSRRFAHAKKLEILDSGCGNGNALGDIKRLHTVGRIVTTGITLQEKHVPYLQLNNVDRVIVGPAESHTFDSEYHFILDFFGASYYSYEEVMPVYSRILAPKGTALLSLPGEEGIEAMR